MNVSYALWNVIRLDPRKIVKPYHKYSSKHKHSRTPYPRCTQPQVVAKVNESLEGGRLLPGKVPLCHASKLQWTVTNSSWCEAFSNLVAHAIIYAPVWDSFRSVSYDWVPKKGYRRLLHGRCSFLHFFSSLFAALPHVFAEVILLLLV